MKLFKTVLASAAVAVMFSGCQDIEEMSTEDLARKGILKNTVSLFNTNGSKASGIDCTVNDSVGINGTVTYGADGTADYGWITGIKYADNSKIDFKVKINIERAIGDTTYITRLTSLNDTKYKAISTAEYEKTSLKDLKKVGDLAADTEIALPVAKDSCFVAKLGGGRGYALAKIVGYDRNFAASTGSKNVGKVTIQYYQIPADSLN